MILFEVLFFICFGVEAATMTACLPQDNNYEIEYNETAQ